MCVATPIEEGFVFWQEEISRASIDTAIYFKSYAIVVKEKISHANNFAKLLPVKQERLTAKSNIRASSENIWLPNGLPFAFSCNISVGVLTDRRFDFFFANWKIRRALRAHNRVSDPRAARHQHKQVS